jgi:hypothetical protein
LLLHVESAKYFFTEMPLMTLDVGAGTGTGPGAAKVTGAEPAKDTGAEPAKDTTEEVGNTVGTASF